MVKKAENCDLESAVNLALALWESSSVNELTDESTEIISNDSAEIFLKYENGEPIGFAQCSLRHDYVEGTESSPVGYLEGIYVKEKFRNRGYAKELLRACEEWAKNKGCSEFASDCELDNENSFLFHKAMNFTEANRIICFNKKL